MRAEPAQPFAARPTLSGFVLFVIMRRLPRRYSMRKMAVVTLFLAGFTARAAWQADRTDPRSILEAYVLAWNHHDFAAIDRLIASDSIHDDIGNAVHAQGPDQVKIFMKSIIAQEPDFKWHIDRVIVS